uniref:ENR1 protein n=1 Tax=Accipiter nisus TaxID=211598 RepID=A0A8B9NFW7_9AVES
MWGAREPIYNLNHIIQLQAIIEIITIETAHALDLLAGQATQMQTAILQHPMVLDYLLAEEGGVCGKLNYSNCCLKIDDSGKIVKQMTVGIRKLAHVPVQTWKG